MNKGLIGTVAFLQAIGLLAADYTAEEVAALIDGLEVVRWEYPAELSEMSRQLAGDVVKCKKCGGKMRLKVTPQVMAKLVELISEKGPYKRELDDSKLCPHCGDGKFYLTSHTVFNKAVRNPDGTVSNVAEKRDITAPVSEEDLLLLYDFSLQRTKHDAIDVIDESLGKYQNLYRIRSTEKFFVQNEEQYNKRLEVLKNTKGLDKKVRESVKKTLEDIAKLSKNAAIFQRLTENATVLRLEDLDGFLKEISDLRNGEFVFKGNSSFGPMTRMLVTARLENMVPLTCPHCNGRFYVADGTNSPQNYGLNDMMSLLAKFDIVPDYSSLCPYCHPETAQQQTYKEYLRIFEMGDGFQRKLDVKIKISGKEYSSSLSPAD
ncbi:MAG: hypothetical protein J5833_01255, partial [Victivallales bacterium]|nr:hypothetical protein [Victivallales bacterium]